VTTGKETTIALVRGPLATLGFRKRSGGIFTTELSPGVVGWVGLNTATKHQRKGEAEVNPVIGVRHQGVEQLIADLEERPFHQYIPPTISTPIGNAMPQQRYISWLIGGPESESTAEDLVAAVNNYGLPFMHEHATLPSLLDAINERQGHRLEYRLPVVLWLLDRRGAALAAVVQHEHGLERQSHPAAEDFRRFAANFRRLAKAAR
jgi:hypothetical protein